MKIMQKANETKNVIQVSTHYEIISSLVRISQRISKIWQTADLLWKLWLKYTRISHWNDDDYIYFFCCQCCTSASDVPKLMVLRHTKEELEFCFKSLTGWILIDRNFGPKTIVALHFLRPMQFCFFVFLLLSQAQFWHWFVLGCNISPNYETSQGKCSLKVYHF